MNEPTFVEINGAHFRIGALDPFQQLHVARRLGPILASVGLSITEILRKGKEISASNVDVVAFMGPVMEIVAKMSDADVNYIVKTCMSVVAKKEGEKWARLMQNEELMYQDLQLPALLRLTVEVVKENLGGFFAQVPGALP